MDGNPDDAGATPAMGTEVVPCSVPAGVRESDIAELSIACYLLE